MADPTPTHRGQKSLVPVPYAFTLGAVNIAGILYYDTASPENSYTDGAFVGVVVGSYHIDKNDAEACADNGLVKVCIMIDFGKKCLFGRLCKRKLTGGWDCDNWTKIVCW